MDTSFMAELEKSIDQRPIMEVSDELWDVIIIGAGPAGSTAAIHLASKGHRVLLVDKERFPREKVCGDVLIYDSIKALERIGLVEKVRRVGNKSNTATVFSPTGVSLSIPGEYITLRRSILDAFMVEKSLRRGVLFCRGEVNGIDIDNDGAGYVSFTNTPKKIRYRVCITATGAHISLAKRLGLVKRIAPSAIAVRCYVHSSFEIDHLVGSYERSLIPGYGWIFPMGKSEYNVGVITDYDKIKEHDVNLLHAFHEFVERFPLAQKLLGQGQISSPLRGGALRCGLEGTKAVASGNVLCAGEVLGTTLPCTYEGIGKAMQSGELVAHAINEALAAKDLDRLKEYPKILEHEMLPKYMGYRIALKWLKSSPGTIGRLMVHRVEKSKFLRKIATGVISEAEDPRRIFSLRGIWRLLRN